MVWTRPLYEPGGGDAELHYVVYGDFPPALAPPTGSILSRLDAAHPRQRRYLDQLRGAGAPGAIAAAPSAVVLHCEVQDPKDLKYLRDSIGLVGWLLEHGGIAVDDRITGQLWTAAEFRAANWQERLHHVRLEWSGGDLGSRGMRKFGRPDVVAPRTAAELRVLTETYVRKLCEALAAGRVVRERERVRGAGLPEFTELLPQGDRIEVSEPFGRHLERVRAADQAHHRAKHKTRKKQLHAQTAQAKAERAAAHAARVAAREAAHAAKAMRKRKQEFARQQARKKPKPPRPKK